MTPTKSYPYAVVNVFTTEPLSGNSLAVFPDASEYRSVGRREGGHPGHFGLPDIRERAELVGARWLSSADSIPVRRSS
jgi:hypothetical protein